MEQLFRTELGIIAAHVGVKGDESYKFSQLIIRLCGSYFPDIYSFPLAIY